MKVLLSKSDNPIYELELAPVLIAIKLWCSFFRNSQVVMYLDNDAARAGLIKMRGATDIGDIIIQDAALLEAQNSFRPWFGRVPTSSNVADGPSRFDCRFVEKSWFRSRCFPMGKIFVPDGVRCSAFLYRGSCGRLDDLTPLHEKREQIFNK